MTELRVITAEAQAADVVETLEEVLERAKRGELSSVAIAWVTRSGAVSNLYSTIPSAPAMIGALRYLERDIMEGV